MPTLPVLYFATYMVKFQKHVSLDNHQTSSGYESECVIRVLCFPKISKQKHSPKPSWQMILHNLRRTKWEERRFQTEMPSANNFIHTWWTPRQGRKFSSQFFTTMATLSKSLTYLQLPWDDHLNGGVNLEQFASLYKYIYIYISIYKYVLLLLW